MKSATRGQHAKLVPESSGKTRYWRSQDGMHNIGRFIPDMNPRTKEEQEKAERERMLTRDQSTKVETEVNIQLGIFTLNNVAMEQLDERIYKMQEFKVTWKYFLQLISLLGSIWRC